MLRQEGRDMAKKKAKAVGQRPGKTRVELRIDDDVFETVRSLAEKAEITVNQLMTGLARWAGEKGQLGEPSYDRNGVVQMKPIAGVVWFGSPGSYLTEEDKEKHSNAFEEDPPEYYVGEHIFTLDFTERRVVREDI